MAQRVPSHEARIRALEQALTHLTNPVSSAEAVTLKEYFQAKFENQERAVAVATATLEKRLEGMNEFRNALKDQSGQFVQRPELDVRMTKLTDDIAELKTFRDRLEGKASAQSVYIAYGISLLGLALSVLSIVLR